MNGAAMRIAPVGIGLVTHNTGIANAGAYRDAGVSALPSDVEITSSVPMAIAGAIHGRIEHYASGLLELRDRA